MSDCLLSALLLAVAANFASASTLEAGEPFQPELQSLRAVLSRAMRCQGIRQLHAAAVHAGRPILDFRLEAKTAGGGDDVGELDRTMLLSLASVSKGMLGTALPHIQEALLGPRLVETRGVVSILKMPLKSVFGDDFWFVDQTRTDLLTLEDLVSHSTGVARHDTLWYLRRFNSKEELAKATGRLQAIRGFRASFRYNNLAWTVADLALQRLTGLTYSQYMQQHLWMPLNMTDTFASSEMNDTLWSRVYKNSRSIIDGIPFDSRDMRNATHLVEAAGGVYTSLDDMIRYMQLHTVSNYSSVRPLPSQFGPVNAFVVENRFNRYFNRDYYTAPDTDFPDLEIESYSKGWLRTWYRNNLAYSHGGSLFDVRCELDVFVKRRLAVFTHTNLANGGQSLMQPLYAAILNKYLADMLLLNASFVTESNVCSLLHRLNTEVMAVPRLNMSLVDVAFCCGSFGQFGFGSVSVFLNRSSGLLNARYGILHVELFLVATKDQYYQFIPRTVASVNSSGALVINVNDTHVHVLNTSLHTQPYVRIYNRSSTGGIVLNYPALELTLFLEKGLDPEGWKRPERCLPGPTTESPSALNRATSSSGSTALFAITAAAIVLKWSLFENID